MPRLGAHMSVAGGLPLVPSYAMSRRLRASGEIVPPFDLLVKGNKSGEWRRGWDSSPLAGCTANTSRLPVRDVFPHNDRFRRSVLCRATSMIT